MLISVAGLPGHGQSIVLDMSGDAECREALTNWSKLWTQAYFGQVGAINLVGLGGFCASRDGKELVK